MILSGGGFVETRAFDHQCLTASLEYACDTSSTPMRNCEVSVEVQLYCPQTNTKFKPYSDQLLKGEAGV